MEKLRCAVARLRPWILVVFGVGALALWLRIHRLGRESLWLDEGFSWRRARLPLEQLIADAIGAHHNPSYFIFLRYWMWLGDDEFMLRLPSAIGGALAAATTAAVGCKLGGPAAGFVAGTLLALAPLHIHFGQETRMYALLSWSASVAVAGLIWLAMHPESAARPILWTARLHWWRRRTDAANSGKGSPRELEGSPRELEGSPRELEGSPRELEHSPRELEGSPRELEGSPRELEGSPPSAAGAWAAYVAGTIVTLYLHNTAALFAVTAGCAALALAVRPFSLRRGFLINFAAANLLVVAGWGPYLHTQLTQVRTFSESYFWAKTPTPKDFIGASRELFLLTSPLDGAIAILLGIAALLGFWSLRKRPEVALALVCLAVLGPVLLYLVSLHKPMFGTRLLLWSAPPFFALVGAGVAPWSGRRAWPSWAAALLLVGAVAWLVQPKLSADYEELTNEPWREVAWTVRSRVIPGARILVASYEESIMLDYYMHRRSYPLLDVPMEIARKRSAWKQVRDVPRAWLIDRKSGKRVRRARNELGARGHVVWDRSWHGRLRVVQFDFIRP